MQRILIVFILLGVSVCAGAQSLADELRILNKWSAGEEVSLRAVEVYGVENCFVGCEISDELFERMKGKSYKENCTVELAELRYIKVLHRDAEGRVLLGEMVCNKRIEADLLEIFRVLYAEEYPIERMVLIDNYGADDGASMRANNSSAFNFRFIAGTEKLSNHSLGLAVDINPLYNPYVKVKDGRTIVDPPEGSKYVNRTLENPFIIKDNDLLVTEFLSHGFTWGGHWNSLKDYQHFEK
ncbi:MAG: M15 family metallopeptidase [Rikenellaceae bacterium]